MSSLARQDDHLLVTWLCFRLQVAQYWFSIAKTPNIVFFFFEFPFWFFAKGNGNREIESWRWRSSLGVQGCHFVLSCCLSRKRSLMTCSFLFCPLVFTPSCVCSYRNLTWQRIIEGHDIIVRSHQTWEQRNISRRIWLETHVILAITQKSNKKTQDLEFRFSYPTRTGNYTKYLCAKSIEHR